MAKGSGGTKSSTSRTPNGMTSELRNYAPKTEAEAHASYELAMMRAGKALNEGNAKNYYIASAESRLNQTIENMRHKEKKNSISLKDNLSYQQWKSDEKRWREKIKKIKNATGNYSRIFNE